MDWGGGGGLGDEVVGYLNDTQHVSLRLPSCRELTSSHN